MGMSVVADAQIGKVHSSGCFQHKLFNTNMSIMDFCFVVCRLLDDAESLDRASAIIGALVSANSPHLHCPAEYALCLK